jgi:hypothetical protein
MAGLEERLSKLESILHRLFCCDTNQFIGPSGPQGPPGDPGIQGPPGVDGLITFQNLNWVGEWVPCVVYDQFDTISYLGSSYFMNCESSATYECELPTENPSCWILLANAGATGPQGPTGVNGLDGVDGANSLRWIAGTTNTFGNPNHTTFNYNDPLLSSVITVLISVNESHNINVGTWLIDLANNISPTSFVKLQITDSLDNSIFGTYDVVGNTIAGLPGSNTYLVLNLDFISGNGSIVTGREYTISWNYSQVSANKTYGIVNVGNLGEELIYDYNVVSSTGEKTDSVYLPDTTQIGKEVVVFSRSGTSGNQGFYIESNSEISIPGPDPVSTGFITNYGIDNGDSFMYAYPNGNYKFTFLGNIATGGKAYWNMEALPNTYPTSGTEQNLLLSSPILNNPRVNTSNAVLNAAALNALYSDLVRGEQVFAPNYPGGGKLFVKNGTSTWLSSSLNTVT